MDYRQNRRLNWRQIDADARTATLRSFPNCVKTPKGKPEYSTIRRWCLEQFGEREPYSHIGRIGAGRGPGVWTASRMFFYFKSPDDAFHFKLRWG